MKEQFAQYVSQFMKQNLKNSQTETCIHVCVSVQLDLTGGTVTSVVEPFCFHVYKLY